MFQNHTFPRFMSRLFNVAILAFVVVAFSTQCATERRCSAKFPIDTLTTVHDSLVYRDTTIFVHLPSEIVHDSIPVDFPCPTPPDYQSKRVRVETRFADASAWIANGKLKIDLNMHDTTLAFVIDSAVMKNTKTITVTRTKTIREKYIPTFYKFALFVTIFVAVLAIIKVVVNSLR